MSLIRAADVYCMLLNLAYEGVPVDPDQVLVEVSSNLNSCLIRDHWIHALAEDMERDLSILAAYYENKVERTRGFDVRQYRDRRGNAT